MTEAGLAEGLTMARQALARGEVDHAEALCQRLMSLTGAPSGVLHLAGTIAAARRDLPRAADLLGQACCSERPAFAVLADHGLVLFRLGRMDEAARQLDLALQQEPARPQLRYYLARALYSLNRIERAAQECAAVLQLQPDMVDARKLMGAIDFAGHRFERALAQFLAGMALEGGSAHMHNNAGICLSALGRHAEALPHFRQALALKPDFAAATSNMAFCLSHQDGVPPGELFAAHQAYGRLFAARTQSGLVHGNTRDAGRPIKLGFVSADLWDHAVAKLFLSVLAALDHGRFDVHIYYNNVVEDAMTARLKRLCLHWQGVAAMSDDQLEQLIRRDGIDILVDLSGHTAGNRLPLFARKPAPVQASWIGYPATTGLDAMDYYLADSYLAPPGLDDPFFTEKIVRLPVVCHFDPDLTAPPPNALPALETGTFTFASFNRNAKLGDPVLGLWAQALRAVPGSRLLLGAIDDDAAPGLLTQRFAALGIDANRLLFRRRASLQDYLRLHHEVDLILDTFPYSGGTTSAQALWMGVPTLTIAGATMSSRQTAALLQHAGLGQFVANSESEFVALAAHWANSTAELDGLRRSLRAKIIDSPLFDAAPVARGLERALLHMWRGWCNGLNPESFDVA